MPWRNLPDRLGGLGLGIAAYLAGVALHCLAPFTRFATWSLALFGAAFGIAAYSSQRCARRRLFLVCACLVFGVWRFDSTIPEDKQLFWLNSASSFVGRVTSVSGVGKKAAYTIRLVQVNGAAVRPPGEGLVVKTGVEVEVGARISFVCTAKIPGTFPANLDRRRLLARKGVWSECNTASDVRTLEPPSMFDPLVWLARWRKALTGRIHRALPPDEASLVAGILYGDTDFSAELNEDFKRAGLMHLVAVSGSNVTIVVGVCLALALGAGLKRRQAFWAVTIALLVFVGFVGFSASVLRAAFMGWLVILARHVGRLARTWRLLLMAAAILNLSNPWLLAFDAGFALSFLATWGLLAWTPIFLRWLGWVPSALGLRETVATTLGATLMTSPYLAWAFGRMSLAGLFTNALALPLVPWVMLWGSTAAAWGSWPGGSIASLPAYGLAHLIILISRSSRLVPWLDWQVPKMEWLMLVASYLWMAIWWKTLVDKPESQDEAVDMDVSNLGLSDSSDNNVGLFGPIGG